MTSSGPRQMLTACSRCRSVRELLARGFGDSTPARRTVRLCRSAGLAPNDTLDRHRRHYIESIPFLDRYAVSEAEQFDNVASSMLTLDQWLKLSRRVNELLSGRPDLSGIVVTTGTDTLEETAYFLHLTVRSDKPVVVVGSMRPPQSLSYDGAANLLQGFRVAADGASRGKRVLVVLNNEIDSAREVSKTNTQSLQAFYAPGYGVLGLVDTDRVVYYGRTERRHTASSGFDVTSIDRLPRVDVLLSYQDAPDDLITRAVEAGAAGIVVAGRGPGG